MEGYEPGQQLNVEEIFKVGEKVDVAGTTNGKGFQGIEAASRLIVVKRQCCIYVLVTLRVATCCITFISIYHGGLFLIRCHQEVEPPQRKHDSRI